MCSFLSDEVIGLTHLEVSQEVVNFPPVAFDVASTSSKQNTHQFDSENVLTKVKGVVFEASGECNE